jgi:hypothetical protein
VADLNLLYVLTVHKAQGSHRSVVICISPRAITGLFIKRGAIP